MSENKLILLVRAFIQAFLSTAVLPQRFKFLYCLLSSAALWGGSIWWTSKGKSFKLMSADCCICIFLEFQSFIGSFEKTLTGKIHKLSFMPICKYLIQRGRRIGEQNGKSFKAFRKIKKKKNN